MIGPFTSFLTFPSTMINIDWNDYRGAQRQALQKCKDFDKQDITLSVSIQYKLV
jgi:hypothetical protein